MDKTERMKVSGILEDLDGCTLDWTDQYISDKADSRTEKILQVIDSHIEGELEGEIQKLADSGKVYSIQGSSTEGRSYIIPEGLLFVTLSDLIWGDYSGCRDMIRQIGESLSPKSRLPQNMS